MENEKKSDQRINLLFQMIGYLHTETVNLKRLNYLCLNELVNMKCEQQKQKQTQIEKLRLQAKRRRELRKNALNAKLVKTECTENGSCEFALISKPKQEPQRCPEH